jgi:hypothetical protein
MPGCRWHFQAWWQSTQSQRQDLQQGKGNDLAPRQGRHIKEGGAGPNMHSTVSPARHSRIMLGKHLQLPHASTAEHACNVTLTPLMTHSVQQFQLQELQRHQLFSMCTPDRLQ